MRWHRKRRGRCRGRPPKPVFIDGLSFSLKFQPIPEKNEVPIHMDPAELETLRLVDLESFTQEEAGARMGVSRGTIWRLLQSARKKAAQALTEARPLYIANNIRRD
ncbi:MAG: DUF134 domain-containing protein [Candidatus Ranarchaeia archaeon]